MAATQSKFSLGSFVVTDSMRNLVLEVLQSGRLSYGPISRQFEQRFAEVQGMDHACLSNSGTSSLVVSVQALKELHGWRDNDEIIVPATTFVASTASILHNRLVPVLVDVDSRHYDIDTELIEEKINWRTQAIMPVSLFGYPCDMVAVRDIANRHGLKVIADNCETTLGRVENLSTDAWADISCHSFYVAHTIIAGVGGMSTTNNPDYAQAMRSRVNHGLDLSELPNGEHYDPSWLARSFRFTSVGHSFRITELEAAIALSQLDDWRAIRDRRNRVAIWIESKLSQFSDHLQLPEKRENTHPCQMCFPIVLKQEAKYNIMRSLRERGIECRDMVPLLNQPCYRHLGWRMDDFPVSKKLLDTGFYIGCHSDITHDDVEYLESVFASYLKGR